jgi:uncharacterized repeat protein (TIGR01451 family)
VELLEQRQMLCATGLGLASLPPGLAIADPHSNTHGINGDPAAFDVDVSPPAALGASDASTALSSALHPLSSIPQLHSNPTARVKLYLDFDGHVEPTNNVTIPVYDRDGDGTTFSDSELDLISMAWSKVSEDYAPFNVDVTTVEPPELAAGVPESVANGVALRVAIGGDGSWTGGVYGGIASVGAFTNSAANVVYVFPVHTGDGKADGDVASHEAGHGFGLSHQSTYDQNGVKTNEYNPGDGTWAPIMGNTYVPITTWYNGTSSNGPTIYQDDMAVLAGSVNGFGYRADDHGDTIATADPLAFDGQVYSGAGNIGTNSDADVWSFTVSAADTYKLRVDPAAIGPNLDAVLELRSATGSLIAMASPVASQAAELLLPLTPANYFLSVTKTAAYGWLGAYTVNVSTPPAGITVDAPSPMITREGGPAVTINVSLQTQPTDDVMIPVSSSNVGEATVSTSSLLFTPTNWNLPQTVTLTSVEDSVSDGDIPYSINFEAATSNDPEYSGLDGSDLTATNLDNSSAGLLYWVDNGSDVIRRSTLYGTDVQIILDLKSLGASTDYVPRYIAVDPQAGKMYWTDSGTGRIQRANLDGSSVETLVSGFTNGGLRGIAVDSAAGKIYWVDDGAQKIQRANLDGSGVEDLVTGALGGVRELTLDLAAGKMYWGDYNQSNIRRANLDGTNIEVLWTGVDADNPAAIALDTSAGKMYWSDAGSDKIMRANLDGSNVELLVDMRSFYPDSTVASLAIDAPAGKIYFSDFINKALYRANLDGSDVVAIVSDGISVAQGITIVAPGITVTPNTGLVTSESGGYATFKVVLNTPPKANVTIPINSGNPSEGSVSATSLIFTPSNWSVPQIVTVVGVDDSLVDGTNSYAVDVGAASSADPNYAGLNPRDVSLTNVDNDIKFRVVNDAATDVAYLYTGDGATRGTNSLAAVDSGPRGIAGTLAGDKSWVIDASRNIYVYGATGALSGSWTAGSMASNANPEGIATDGTDVWIVDNRSDTVYRYAAAASRLSGTQSAASSFKLNSSNTNPKDIVTDGQSLWVVDDATADKVFKYSLAGSLIGSWTIDAANKLPTGIALDSASPGNIWIVDSGTDRIYQYTTAASRTSGSQTAAVTFALASGNGNPQGIASNVGSSTPTASADLALSSSAVSTSTEGNLVTFNLTVTNNGPTTAQNAMLTDTLGANWVYSSASTTQGTVQQSGNSVTFNLGTLAAGQTITASVLARALESGNLSNLASVTANALDANLNNNTSSRSLSVAAAPIMVSGPITVSGTRQNNTTTATFTHASGVHPTNYYVATINWGDGTTSTGNITLSGTTYTVKGMHTYASSGAHTVTTTVARASVGLLPKGSNSTVSTASLSPLALDNTITAGGNANPISNFTTKSKQIAALAREQMFEAFMLERDYLEEPALGATELREVSDVASVLRRINQNDWAADFNLEAAFESMV